MSTYQVVPYLISVKPRGTHGGETRPIDDLDGKKTHLSTLLGYTFTDAGAQSFRFANNEDITYRMAGDLAVGTSAIYFSVTQGTKGIQSKIGENGEVVFQRSPNHVEDIDFRNLVVFPAHGKYAVVLTERIGNRGVASFLGKLLVDTLRTNFHEVTTTFKALTTAADLKNLNIQLRSLDFQFPKKTDPSGKLIDMSKADGRLSIRWKFGSPHNLSNFTNADGAKLDADKIFGVLDTGLSAGGFDVSGERLKELGVQADLHVTLPSGNQRSFTLGSQEGPALAYTLEPQKPLAGTTGTAAQRVRPADDDFLRVCKDVVSDVAGTFGVSKSTADYCAIPDPSDSVDVPNGWKVVWNVPDHIAPGNS